MFRWPRKSSPVTESAADADDVGDESNRLGQMLLEWRADAKRVGRAYKA